jgi:hypothetical protein
MTSLGPRRLFMAAATLGATLGATFGAAGFASGAELDASPKTAPEEQWTLRFTPYGWPISLNGKQTVKGRTADVNANFIEILEKSDSLFAFMSYLEARKGPLSLFADVVYGDITASASRSRDETHYEALGLSAGVDYQFAVVEVGGAYEIARWGAGADGGKDSGAPASFTAIDLLAGARYWWQEADLSFRLSGVSDTSDMVVTHNLAIARSGSVDWIDPLVGVRLRRQLAPGAEFALTGDVGGFGVGSVFSWQLAGVYSWELAVRERWTLAAVVGYRALYVDYEHGTGRQRFEYNMIEHGPVIGVSLRFY